MAPSERQGDWPLVCLRCGRAVRRGEGEFYVVRVEAFADPSPPGDLGEASSAAQAADIEALIASMSDLSERELMDQVYRKMTFILCNACYVEWIENPAEEGHAGN